MNSPNVSIVMHPFTLKGHNEVNCGLAIIDGKLQVQLTFNHERLAEKRRVIAKIERQTAPLNRLADAFARLGV